MSQSTSISFPYDRATIRRARTIVKAAKGTYTWPVVKRARTICRTHEAAMKAQNVGRYAATVVNATVPSSEPTKKQIDFFNHICAEIDEAHVAVRVVACSRKEISGQIATLLKAAKDNGVQISKFIPDAA